VVCTTPIKTPLRYPGGKSRAIPLLARLLPQTFDEYREPMVGGGSMFLHIRQKYPHVRVWINDLNPEVTCFWQAVRDNVRQLVQEIHRFCRDEDDGRQLFATLKALSPEELPPFSRAARFFILNRIGFSGTVECGGYSERAFRERLTATALERLNMVASLLQTVRITNLDYSELLTDGDREVFTFLDPPYLKATSSRLYGRNGILHTTYDHQRLATHLQHCRHRWLVTYDDSPAIRNNLAFAWIYTWELQYGMNNYRRSHAPRGQELLVSNYPLPLCPVSCPCPPGAKPDGKFPPDRKP